MYSLNNSNITEVRDKITKPPNSQSTQSASTRGNLLLIMASSTSKNLEGLNEAIQTKCVKALHTVRV